jgi:hypothetical protein
MSLYFNRTEDPNGTMSVLIDEDNVMKIRKPKIIIANMLNLVYKLADEIG